MHHLQNRPQARPAQRDDLLRQARADWAAGTGLREDYAKHRPNFERAVAQVATWRGRRLKLRYRSTAKNHARLKRRTAALNLRNLIGKGLARRDGAWVLTTWPGGQASRHALTAIPACRLAAARAPEVMRGRTSA